MGERKGQNHYYPPDYDPKKGSLNTFMGVHALRERASKISEGILIIRFEMPYNMWCGGCGKHIGMGVRFNAEKKKIGKYYTTAIWKFTMKCPLCPQKIEMRTDPQNCEYEIMSGGKRKEERWDTEAAGNVQSDDREVRQKLINDAMYKLEHGQTDKNKARKVAPTLSRLEDIRDVWRDDHYLNSMARRKFRNEKKDITFQKNVDKSLLEKAGLPDDIQLVKERADDVDLAKRIRYGEEDIRPDLLVKAKKRSIKQSSIFTASSVDSSVDDNQGDGITKLELAKQLAGVTAKKRKLSAGGVLPFSSRNSPSPSASLSATNSPSLDSNKQQTALISLGIRKRPATAKAGSSSLSASSSASSSASRTKQALSSSSSDTKPSSSSSGSSSSSICNAASSTKHSTSSTPTTSANQYKPGDQLCSDSTAKPEHLFKSTTTSIEIDINADEKGNPEAASTEIEDTCDGEMDKKSQTVEDSKLTNHSNEPPPNDLNSYTTSETVSLKANTSLPDVQSQSNPSTKKSALPAVGALSLSALASYSSSSEEELEEETGD